MPGLISFNQQMMMDFKKENEAIAKDLRYTLVQKDGFHLYDRNNNLVKHEYSPLKLNAYLKQIN